MRFKLLTIGTVGLMAAVIATGVALAGVRAQAPAKPAKPAAPAAVRQVADTDNIQEGDQTSPDSTTAAVKAEPANPTVGGSTKSGTDNSGENESSGESENTGENGESDGPGGHEDPPGQDVNHEFQGE